MVLAYGMGMEAWKALDAVPGSANSGCSLVTWRKVRGEKRVVARDHVRDRAKDSSRNVAYVAWDMG
jgi:hypothetical protein